jgi:hypothetical protein
MNHPMGRHDDLSVLVELYFVRKIFQTRIIYYVSPLHDGTLDVENIEQRIENIAV